MENPETNGHKSITKTLAQAVIQEIARIETHYLGGEDAEWAPPRHMAAHLGRACIRAVEGQNKVANHHVRKARSMAKKRQGKKLTIDRVNKDLQDIYGDYVQFSSNPNALEQKRREHYDRTINFLGRSVVMVRKASLNRIDRNGWIGTAHELTMLGALNYGIPHYRMALPALTHHDRGAEPRYSFDTLLGLGNAENENTEIHKIQVKSRVHNHDEANFGYDPSITVIEARSAFGYVYRHLNRRDSDFVVADALLAEAEGQADELQLSLLDMVTDGLIRKITYQPQLQAAQ